MEKQRLFSFMVVAVAVMIGFSMLQRAVLPPPPVAKNKGGDQQAADKDGKGKAKGKKGGKGKPDKGKPDKGKPDKGKPDKGKDAKGKGDKQKGDKKGSKKSHPPTVGSTKKKPEKVIPNSWYSLGSLDPESPYPFLVVFSNRGGTIDSVYLNSPQYRDLEQKTGFLGPLVLTNAKNTGCVVNLVPPGSAAAAAGLQVGDTILAINSEQLTSLDDYTIRIGKTKPKEAWQLKVERQENGQKVTRTLNVKLRPRPLALISPDRSIERRSQPASFAMTLKSIASGEGEDTSVLKAGAYTIDGLAKTLSGNWLAKVEGNAIEFRYQVEEEQLAKTRQSGSLELWKRFEITSGEEGGKIKEHALNLTAGVRNTGSVSQSVSYMLYGPSDLPTEGWWYTVKIANGWNFGSFGARDVVSKVGKETLKLTSATAIVKQAKDKPTEPLPVIAGGASDVKFVGVDSLYFSVALLPDPGIAFSQGSALTMSDVETLEGKHVRLSNSTFRVAPQAKTIEPGKSLQHSYRVFLGPKENPLLAKYELRETIVYGWFSIFAKPLSGLLHFLHDYLFGNYAIAILALTVLVRGAMFPLSRKAAQSAQMMQVLAPEMKKLNEKYKNDLQKRGEALRALWAKHNYNPYGSCLLMFVQLPVFIGLFRSLSVDIALRGEPFIPGIQWCSNLAGPDQMMYWANWMPAMFSAKTGWLGPYFNVLPICTIILFFIHQKLFTPPPTDDQQKMAQTMMKFMMFFIALLFFKVPSGLCLYFIASSMWGLAERIFLPKPATVGDDASTPAETKQTPTRDAEARARARKKRKKR